MAVAGFLAIPAILTWSMSAFGGLFDDTEKLAGQFIQRVGELEPLDCPIGGNYDCLVWPNDLYRFGFRECFQIIGYYGGYSRKKALLAIDQSKVVSIFVIEDGIGSVAIKQYPVIAYECPALY